MAKPLARVLALLGILQGGGTRTLRELADRLGVDERTVRRYIDHLLDLDVPVESVRGRWYATGLDSRSGQVRSFRLDRITDAALQEGQFSVPRGFDPAAQVVQAVSGASYRHEVSVRVHGGEQAVRMRMPGSIATVERIESEPGWLRVRWRAEQLNWVPSVLAGLDLPFVIEEPDELRERVRALAGRLASWAETL
jgi:predicted DNA-binding transcriptional regulator YafY